MAALVAGCLLVAALRAQDTRNGDIAPLPDDGSAAEEWVTRTLREMTLDEKVGQLFIVGVESGFTPTDSDEFAAAARDVREYHVGGLIVFGVTEPSPGPLANAIPAGPALGQPLSVASTLNRLQSIARVPLLVAADFETGLGMRIAGGTTFPRAMAFGAAGAPGLVEQAARVTAREARAIGVHVNLAPVSDVNNNPRNPVINTRSFGEAPGAVATMVAAYVRGLQSEGMLATLKHFPGHGDTAVDSHLGLPLVPHARARLDAIELPPFRAGMAAGAAVVMTSHLELPGIDPRPETPATFSEAVVTTLLRDELGFDGLIFTDSMKMQALGKIASSREAVVRALLAGHDMLIDVADAEEAFFAVGAAIERGDISLDRLDQSVTRILRAKARLGLHRQRIVSLDAVADRVGTRESRAIAATAGERAITMIKDERDSVPLRLDSSASVLYLSVVDYPGGWNIAAPSRQVLPALRARWPRLAAIEVNDRSSAADLTALAASLDKYDAIVAGVFVRSTSGSGRMDLPAPLAQLLNEAGRRTRERGASMVAMLFGNPYTATFLQDVPALLLAYDYYDLAERSAVRALLGDAPITGHVPITLSRDVPPR
jgi:beta-N-acetylhexosaminidase